MTRCNKCGREYQKGVKNFCSQACYEADIQKKIIDSTWNDLSYSKKSSK